MKLKMFRATYNDRVGEDETSCDQIIFASSEKSARERATRHLRNWYATDDREKDGDGYLFFGHHIVTLVSLEETTADEFIERHTLS